MGLGSVFALTPGSVAGVLGTPKLPCGLRVCSSPSGQPPDLGASGGRSLSAVCLPGRGRRWAASPALEEQETAVPGRRGLRAQGSWLGLGRGSEPRDQVRAEIRRCCTEPGRAVPLQDLLEEEAGHSCGLSWLRLGQRTRNGQLSCHLLPGQK